MRSLHPFIVARVTSSKPTKHLLELPGRDSELRYDRRLCNQIEVAAAAAAADDDGDDDGNGPKMKIVALRGWKGLGPGV